MVLESDCLSGSSSTVTLCLCEQRRLKLDAHLTLHLVVNAIKTSLKMLSVHFRVFVLLVVLF